MLATLSFGSTNLIASNVAFENGSGNYSVNYPFPFPELTGDLTDDGFPTSTTFNPLHNISMKISQ